MARESKIATPTANDVEMWLQNPQLLELRESERQERLMRKIVERAVKKISISDYVRRCHALEVGEYPQGKKAIAEQEDKTLQLVHKMMATIKSNSEYLMGRSNNDEPLLIPFFNPPLSATISPNENFYRLQTLGRWNKDADADFEARRIVLPHIMSYRLAVLKILGFKLGKSGQIAGIPAYTEVLKQRNFLSNGEGNMAEINVAEYVSPRKASVSIRVYIPQSAAGGRGIREMICVKSG